MATSKSTESSKVSENPSINESLVNDSKVHINVSQDVLITTEDKVKLCLSDHLAVIEKKNSWQAPAGIFFTILTTLLTTTSFRNFFILNADQWKVAYIFGLIISLIWSLNTLKYIRNSSTIQDVVNAIKKYGKKSEDKAQELILLNEITNNSSPIPHDNLSIIEAKYGSGDTWIDITDKVSENITNSRLTLVADNTLAESDPTPGIKKTLNVRYSIDGIEKSVIIPENEKLVLP